MKMQEREQAIPSRYSLAGLVVALLALTIMGISSTSMAEDSDRKISFDGLVLLEDTKVSSAYVDPDADFSLYKRVKILEPYVAFRKNWRRDRNRKSTDRISAREVEKIKVSVAALFKEVFVEALEAGDGFEVVDVTGEDVLLLRPAIIDLDIGASDNLSSDRGMTFTATSGGATLYIEIFDSESGDIIARAADRQALRQSADGMIWSNRATNKAAGRRMLRRWADLLRNFLDKYYEK